MFDELKKLNIATFSDTELRVLIRQIYPIVLFFIKASQKLLNEKDIPNESPCSTCEKANICKKPCELVENLLPGYFKGYNNTNLTCGSLIDNVGNTNINDEADCNEISQKYDNSFLKAIDKVRSDDIFILYKNCIHLFSKKEWQIVTLKIEKGLTYKTIGKILGIGLSTTSDTFHRAKGKMERHYTNMKHVKKRKNT